MKTDIKNFPRGLDEKDLLYLIWKELKGGSSGGSDSDSGDGGSGCECLAPMIVAGTVDENVFTPGSGAPTWADAQAHMFQGGLIYFLMLEDGEPFSVVLASAVDDSEITASDSMFSWFAPSDQDDNEPVG